MLLSAEMCGFGIISEYSKLFLQSGVCVIIIDILMHYLKRVYLYGIVGVGGGSWDGIMPFGNLLV